MGARQVGKMYLVKDIFAETYYKNNYIYIDCKIEDEIREFCTKTANAGKIIEYISLRKGKQVMEQVYKYLLVGGMPEAVETCIDGENLFESREILKVLYDNYLADINKGFKQNEGQFFTPIPITHFIWESLLIERMIKKAEMLVEQDIFLLRDLTQ